MIKMDQRLRDVRNDKEANFWLKSYSSVPEINRLLRLLEPFKFSTLERFAPNRLKGFAKDLVGFFNGQDNVIPVTDSRSILLWNEKDIPLYDGVKENLIWFRF